LFVREVTLMFDYHLFDDTLIYFGFKLGQTTKYASSSQAENLGWVAHLFSYVVSLGNTRGNPLGTHC
jgi:hypothetical protein